MGALKAHHIASEDMCTIVGEPRIILDNIAFGEGPRFRRNKLYFSDMMAGQPAAESGEVIAMDIATGSTEVVLRLDTKPSGLGWMPDGSMLVVSMQDQKLLRVSTDGALSVHADLSGTAVESCNDMIVTPSGRAYVGSFGIDFSTGPSVEEMIACTAPVVRVEPDGSCAVATGEMHFPNGSVLTPDGKCLIVAETFAKRLTAFDVAANGDLSNRRVWAELEAGPDGISLDAQGAIWVAIAPLPGVSRGGFIRVLEGGEITDRIGFEQYEGCYDGGAFACMLGKDQSGEAVLFMMECDTDRAGGKITRGSGRVRSVRVSVGGAESEASPTYFAGCC